MSWCSTLRGRLKRWVGPRPHGGVHAAASGAAHGSSWLADVGHTLVSAVFVASLFHVLHPWFKAFDVVPFIVASPVVRALNAGTSGSSHPSDAALSSVALVGISKPHFASLDAGYQGLSPLDRCQLTKDLGKLLALPTVLTVAVDLDLSPSPREAVDGSPAWGCRRQLDALLDAHPKRLVLLKPFDAEDQQPWMKERTAKGVTFADGELEVSLGVFSQYRHPEQGAKGRDTRDLFGEAVARRIGTLAPATVCHERECLVSFSYAERLYNHGEPLDITKWPDAYPLEGVRHVIFGARYSEDDRFLTPVGYLYGMDVHAAVASRPRFAASHWVGFAADIAFGVLLGLGLKGLWRGYFDWKLPRVTQHAGRPAFAYWWLFGVAVFYVALVALAMVVVVGLYTHGVWFSPIGMALGMAVDAFVLQGVEEAEHRLGHHQHVPFQAPRSLLGRLLASLPCVLYAATVLYALALLFHLVHH